MPSLMLLSWQECCGSIQGGMGGSGLYHGAPAGLDGCRLPAAIHSISGYAEELLRAGFAGEHGGISAVHILERAQEQKRGRRLGGDRFYIEIHGKTRVSKHSNLTPGSSTSSCPWIQNNKFPHLQAEEPTALTLLPEKHQQHPQKGTLPMPSSRTPSLPEGASHNLSQGCPRALQPTGAAAPPGPPAKAGAGSTAGTGASGKIRTRVPASPFCELQGPAEPG